MVRTRRSSLISVILALSLAALIAPNVAAVAPSNDDFANAVVASPLPYNASADTTDATVEGPEENTACGPITNTVWYQFTSATTRFVRASTFGSNFDTVMAIWEGASLGSMTEVTCGDDTKNVGDTPTPNRNSRVSWRAMAGVTYHIQVGGFDGESGNVSFQLRKVKPPSNDNFANARSVTSLPRVFNVRTVNSSTQPGELAIQGTTQCSYGRASVWYRVNLPTDTYVQVDNLGAKMDTMVGVYTGASLASLQQVACGEDTVYKGVVRLPARVGWKAEGGTDYYVQVMGFFGQTASKVPVRFRKFSPIGNDSFASARVITGGLPFSAPVNLLNATIEPDELPTTTCATDSWHSGWLKYTAAADTTLTATVGVTDDRYSASVAVYTGADLQNLTEIACATNFDQTNGPTTSVSFSVSNGETYYFRVGNNFGESGPVSFSLT